MGRALGILALLAAVSAAGPKAAVPYAHSWDEAVEEARARNVPIVVHRHGFY